MANLDEFFYLEKVSLEDTRESRGEVIHIPLKPNVSKDLAIQTICRNLADFMQRITGKGYEPTKEGGVGSEYLVREPGHQSYGLKLLLEGGKVIISRVAILEDETAFRRYVKYLKELIPKPKEAIEPSG